MLCSTAESAKISETSKKMPNHLRTDCKRLSQQRRTHHTPNQNAHIQHAPKYAREQSSKHSNYSTRTHLHTSIWIGKHWDWERIHKSSPYPYHTRARDFRTEMRITTETAQTIYSTEKSPMHTERFFFVLVINGTT